MIRNETTPHIEPNDTEINSYSLFLKLLHSTIKFFYNWSVPF